MKVGPNKDFNCHLYCTRLLFNMIMLQMDVFNTFIELLRQTGNVTKGQIEANEMRQVANPFPTAKSLYF